MDRIAPYEMDNYTPHPSVALRTSFTEHANQMFGLADEALRAYERRIAELTKTHESLMDELVKLANMLESRAQSCRVTHKGRYMAYDDALVSLQEVMRNA